MKHSLRIVTILILFFFVSQVVGLFVISKYIEIKDVVKVDLETNQTYTVVEAVPIDLPNNIERPEFENVIYFIGYIILAIIIATLLFLFLIRLKTMFFWKLWFFFAVFLCLSVAFSAFFNSAIATILSFILALWKILKPSLIVQNVTEVFMYGGLAAIFVPIPIVNEYAMLALLVIVSFYDAYAVWKSKHMVKIARYQANSKVFAGLLVPYSKKEVGGKKIIRISKESKKAKDYSKGKLKFQGIRTAILGGGDVAFPLLFSGAVLKSQLIERGFLTGFSLTLIIPIFVTIALALLFFKGREDRFYPAMPFLTAGCIVGYVIMNLLSLVL